MIHIMQKDILARLTTNAHLRYSQLKPRGIEGNHFMYHLKALIGEGYVTKTEQGYYALTVTGKHYVDGLSLESLSPRKQPNIVTLITVQNTKGQWLVYKRNRQPLLGQIGFVYGKLHLGENITQSAHRELKEKTGLQCELAHRGDGYITIYEGAEPMSQIMFHFFYGKAPFGEIAKTSKPGKAAWAWAEEFAHPPYMASMPDLHREIVKNIDSKDRFFVELTYR